MLNAAERMHVVRQQLIVQVRDALDDVSPELAESAIGRMTQAGVLVELAAELLAAQVGPEIASRMVTDFASRPRMD